MAEAGIYGLTVPHLEQKEGLAFCHEGKMFKNICDEAEKYLQDKDEDKTKDDDEAFINYKKRYPAGISM